MLRTLPTLPVGHELQGRYRVLRKLGTGGYGSVYLADDTRLSGRQVAIKELSNSSQAAQELFRQEAKMLAALNHRGLVRVSDFFNEGRSLYLVMDYIQGRDLLDLAVVADEEGRMLPVDKVVGWMTQVCEAVAYLHRQNPPIIHRDIKPANIRLSTMGKVILVDFGIAKVDKTKTGTMAKAVSQGFSPPEQYSSRSGTDTRSDVYALGATLYCLLTVTPPPDSFELAISGRSIVPPGKINPSVPRQVEEVVLKAMALNRNQRYRHAGEMLAAMQRLDKSSSGPRRRRIFTPRREEKPPPPKEEPTDKGLETQYRCPSCHANVRATARFCPRCGRPLGTPCPRCGTMSRLKARFCARCRMPLRRQGA